MAARISGVGRVTVSERKSICRGRVTSDAGSESQAAKAVFVIVAPATWVRLFDNQHYSPTQLDVKGLCVSAARSSLGVRRRLFRLVEPFCSWTEEG
jgi:hypothetical protein